MTQAEFDAETAKVFATPDGRRWLYLYAERQKDALNGYDFAISIGRMLTRARRVWEPGYEPEG